MLIMLIMIINVVAIVVMTNDFELGGEVPGSRGVPGALWVGVGWWEGGRVMGDGELCVCALHNVSGCVWQGRPRDRRDCLLCQKGACLMCGVVRDFARKGGGCATQGSPVRQWPRSGGTGCASGREVRRARQGRHRAGCGFKRGERRVSQGETPRQAGSASRRAGRAVVSGGVGVLSARVGRRARQGRCRVGQGQRRVSQGGPSRQAGSALRQPG